MHPASFPHAARQSGSPRRATTVAALQFHEIMHHGELARPTERERDIQRRGRRREEEGEEKRRTRRFICTSAMRARRSTEEPRMDSFFVDCKSSTKDANVAMSKRSWESSKKSIPSEPKIFSYLKFIRYRKYIRTYDTYAYVATKFIFLYIMYQLVL